MGISLGFEAAFLQKAFRRTLRFSRFVLPSPYLCKRESNLYGLMSHQMEPRKDQVYQLNPDKRYNHAAHAIDQHIASEQPLG